MGERICDVCGRKKTVEGGKVCERSHFICRDCIYSGRFLFVSARKQCPLDQTRLR